MSAAPATASRSSRTTPARALGLEDRDLGAAVGIAHRDAHEEPVELGFGQGIGAFELDRVLRGDDHERRRQPIGVGVDGDLALFHRLEQRRLGLRRRTVDLVGQHHVGEDAAGPELERFGGPVPHRHAEHVGRQEVGRELDAVPGAGDRAGDRLRERRLADARDVLDEEVTLGEQAEEREAHLVGLALDDALDVGEQRVEERGDDSWRVISGPSVTCPGSPARDRLHRARRAGPVAPRQGTCTTCTVRRVAGPASDQAWIRIGGSRGSVVDRWHWCWPARLWATALRQGVRMCPPGWWRRPPFLPLPDREYLRFRLETQYGSGGPDDPSLGIPPTS